MLTNVCYNTIFGKYKLSIRFGVVGIKDNKDMLNDDVQDEKDKKEAVEKVEVQNEPQGETITIGKRLAFEIFEWVEIFTIALATVVLMFTFLMKIVTVDGTSMDKTLHESDFLTVSNLFYTPKQGDIVVLQVPELGDHAPLIKRVIATEGQVVDINFDTWEVSVDGVVIDEPYVNYVAGQSMYHGTSTQTYPLTIEKGKVFVLGDNRQVSKDSRDAVIQQVDVKNVFGRVLIRIFPFNKFGTVKPNV